MIIQARRYLKSKGFKIAVWVFLVVIAGGVVFLQFFINLFERSPWALKINGDIVSEQQFTQKLFLEQEYIKALKSQLGPQADMFLQLYGLAKDPSELAKNQIIRERLLNKEVKKIRFSLDPEYVAEKIHDPSFVGTYLVDIIPLGAFLPGRGLDPARLYSELKRIRMTEAEFEHEVDDAIKRYILVDQLLTPATYVPEFSKEYEYAMWHAPRTVSYLQITYQDQRAQEDKKEIPDEELKAFFAKENRKNRYLVPEKRSGTMWRFDAGKFGLTIPEKRVEDYYNQHKSDFVKERAKIQVRHLLLKVDDSAMDTQVRRKAEEIHAQLMHNPEGFEEAMRNYSQSEDSANEAGLFSFSRGETGNVPLEKASFLLSKDGQIAPVVRTAEGYEIIQRVTKKPTVYRSLQEVQPEIVDILTQKKFEQRFTGDVRGFLRKKKDLKDGWRAFVNQRSATRQQVKDILIDDSNIRLAKALYGLKKEDEYSAYLDGQIGVVVRLDERKGSHTPPFESLRAQVEDDRRAYLTEKALEAALKDIHFDASKTSLELAASKKGLPVKQVSIDPQEENSLKELEEAGLPLAKMIQLENIGKHVRTMVSKDGYIIRLDAVEGVDLDNIEDQKKDELAARMVQETGTSLTNGYIASLYRDATIKTNTSFIES